MFEIVKKVIESKIYELSAILKKIDTVWVQGNLSDEEREELISLARKNAEAQQSVDVLAKLEELDKRVKALEDERVNGEEPTDYPDFEVGKWYYNGDVVMFDGVAYKCIAPEGRGCTWSPADYPAYWEVVE